MKEKVSPFAPSTPILRRLNGASLQSYWFLLQAHQPDGLPELAWPWEAVADHMLWKGLLGCVVGLIGWFVLQSPLAAIELLTAYFCMSMWEKLRLSGNPLPQNIVTFGDLARLIAQQRPARA